MWDRCVTLKALKNLILITARFLGISARYEHDTLLIHFRYIVIQVGYMLILRGTGLWPGAVSHAAANKHIFGSFVTV